LRREVQRRGHPLHHSLRPAPRRRAHRPGRGAARFRDPGLQWMGPRGPHARPQGQALLPRGQHLSGDDRPLARADGGASREIVRALQGRVKGTFFTVDLEAVRALFEGIPWVRRAELRRGWPDRLEVRVEEHVALARWGQRREPRLVNTHGELFLGQSDATLPVFSGPAGSEGEVTQRYLAFRGLLGPLALEPRQVLLSSRLS